MKKVSQFTGLWVFSFIAAVALGAFIWTNLSPSAARVDPGNITVLSGPRGKITDRDGVVLVTGQRGKRVHRFDALFQPVVGYAVAGIGSDGIESRFAGRLTSTGRVGLSYFGAGPEPPPLRTTLSLSVQAAADRALGARRGAVVVLDASEGDVWAQVSHPNYSPRVLSRQWKTLRASPESPLFDRASSASRYPPGSVMKIVDALLLSKRPAATFTCSGAVTVDGLVIRCSHPHGRVSGLADGLARSCNSMHIKRIMSETSADEFYRTARKLGIVVPDSVVGGGAARRALAVIGQGGVLLSPMQAARIAASIANDGMMPEPQYVHETTKLVRVMDPEEARSLRHLMEGVVRNGTGRGVADLVRQGARLALKTGTAEVDGKRNDYIDWTVAIYTPPGGKRTFAIVAVVEGAQTYASDVCLPMIRQVANACRSRVEDETRAAGTGKSRAKAKKSA